MTKECPHCGAKSPDDATKCQWCGKGWDEQVEEIREVIHQDSRKEQSTPQQEIEEQKNRKECEKCSIKNPASNNSSIGGMAKFAIELINRNLTIFECIGGGIVLGVMLICIIILIGSIWGEVFWAFWKHYNTIIFPITYIITVIILIMFYSNKKKLSEEEIIWIIVIFSLGLLYALAGYYFKESGIKPEDMPQLW